MDEAMLAGLEETPDRLANEVDELSEGELVKRPQDGGWNLKELAGHMVEDERVWGHERLPRILAEENPVLPGYDQDAAVRNAKYGTDPIGNALAEWKSLREQTVALLRGMRPEDLSRTGRHEERGPITAAEVASILAEHDAEHLRQALALKGLSREPSS